MPASGETIVEFAGEERRTRIRLGEIRRIEDKCGTGIGEVVRRLARAVFVTAKLEGIEALAAGTEIHADDVREPIYQGLLGSGLSALDATRLLKSEIDERGLRGLLDNASVALTILWGAQSAAKDGDAGEDRAGENPAA